MMEKKQANMDLTSGSRGRILGLRATKRESSVSSAASPSASGNGVPRSPPAIPAKRNRSPAADSSLDHVALPESWEDKDGLKFHVHQRNGVKICDSFLLGNCPLGQSCRLHHTRYPYHWQLKKKECQGWQSLSDMAQQQLEKLYSDFAEVHVTLVDKQGISGILHFDLMRVESFGSYNGIRRLSNTCSPQTNPHLPTKWTWYWKSDSDWMKSDEVKRSGGAIYAIQKSRVMSKPLSSDQLLAFEKGLHSDHAEIQCETPVVGPKDLEQSPEMGRHQRTIQHRPVYRSLLSMAPFLQTVWKTHSKVLQTSAPGISGEDPTDEYYGSYPARLLFPSVGPASNQFVQLEVDPREAAYRSTCALFHDSFLENEALVLGIYRIWNEVLWQNYIRKKKSMSESLSQVKDLQLEKHLFYGTWAERNSAISRMNFDPCLPGLCPPIYGQGTYFHVDAAQAHRYTQLDKDKLRYMFLAKVLVGRTVSGEEHYRQTKKLLPAQETTYESCVDNMEHPKVFVMLNRSQCYPYFLICYKFLSDPVAVGI